MKEKKPLNIEIGQRVKKNREAAGLTQEAFAEMDGLVLFFVTGKNVEKEVLLNAAKSVKIAGTRL